jgi:phage-related protein
VFEVRFFATAAGRCPATEFLDALPGRDRAQIVADIMAFRDHGLQAPISMKPIKGRQNRGLFEIRTGGFRTFFCQKGGVVWILHVCKKQYQDAGIDAARARMKKL